MTPGHFALLIGVAGAVTLVVTPLAGRLGIALGIVSRPGGRNVHEGLVPRIGGIGLFAGVMSAIAVQLLGEQYVGWTRVLLGNGGNRVNVAGLLAGLTLMFLIGLADDMWNLRPAAKFTGQVAAAIVMVLSGLRIEFVGDPFGGGIILLGLLALPVTVAYLVGFANVINLIDGLDGLAAGVSAIAASSLLVLAVQSNQLGAAAYAAALIGSCLGFLRYNSNPASVFMGDSGSMFLGFSLATVSLLGVMKTTAAIALAVPLLIIGVPIFDTASAIVRRLRHNRPVHEADSGHIHHRLLGRGFDQRQTVLIIYLWSGALALGGYTVRYAPGPMKLIALSVLFVVTAFMAYWLGLYDAAHHHDEEVQPPAV